MKSSNVVVPANLQFGFGLHTVGDFHIRNRESIPETLSHVSDLIDNDTGWWIEPLLEQHFAAEDVECIRSIPLRNPGMTEKWVWHPNKSGLYTVKSAYYVALRTTAGQTHLDDQSRAANKEFWTHFWKFRTPKRALHFGWRMLTDSLPTAMNLRTRGVDVTNECPFCLEDGGTATHLFFHCDYAKEVWAAVGLSNVIMGAQETRADSWFRPLLAENEDDVCTALIMLSDGIWFQRNCAIFRHEHRGAREIAASVVAGLRKYAAAQGWQDAASPALLPRTLLRPPETGAKVYFDAGILDGAAGVGVIAMDVDGNFLRAIARRIPNIQDPFLAECLAMEEALLLISDLAIPSASVIGDALNVIYMVQGEADCHGSCTTTVLRLRNLLESSSVSGPFWVPRDDNHLADSLADFC